MIYLENNNGTQQIFIPKNLNISINKTYDEGFQDGMEYQKGKLTDLNVTENGVYTSENGYKQVNVEVPLDNEPCNLGELEYNVETDYYVVNALQQGYDGFNLVKIDATEYGQNKFDEGYVQGVNAGGECKVTEYDITIDSEYVEYTAMDYDFDGFSKVKIDATEYGNNKYNQGYSDGVNATDFSSEQIENKYSHLAFITRNIFDTYTVVDKTKLLDKFDNYIQNGSINITQFKNGICLAMDDKYLNPDFNGGCVVRKIEDGAIDWNLVDIFRSYTILEFGENMTRDKGSNLLSLYIYASTLRNETVTFNDGCFATSNRLNKIVFEEPFNVIVNGNPFEGIESFGQFIVKGTEDNRSKYTDLINLLPSDWEVIFNPDYNE